MATSQITQLGQVNNAGDIYAMFLLQFSGEVMAQFARQTQAANIFMTRTLTSGDSATFPAFGRVTASHHTPGENILTDGTLLGDINIAERIVYVDELLQASVFVDRLDELMNHWEVRGPFARELGGALARLEDERLYKLAVLAARDSATVTGGPAAGGTISDGAMESSVAIFIDSIFEAAERLDTRDIPAEDRFLAMRPDQYYLLLSDGSGYVTDSVNKDFTTDNGGVDTGIVKRIAGFTVIKTNSMPRDNITDTGGRSNANVYSGDFTLTRAVAFHKSAVGSVSLMDVAMESEYMTEYQGTLMLAKRAVGHGILRPESAVELADTV